MSTLYPLSEKSFSAEAFGNPAAEYRGTPFWSWNNRLDVDQLKRQIEIFREMGMGGAHMHPRTGLATEYMSEEFLDIVAACVDKFEQEGMLGWLYDEDRWPSGFAGGLATREEKYRARHLLFTPRPYGSDATAAKSRSGSGRNEQGRLLARYSVRLNADGTLAEYSLLADGQKAGAGAREWYAYLEVAAAPCSWHNNQTYVDVLNPAALGKFIEVTHERYFKRLGDKFGKSVPAIFTDEPMYGAFLRPLDTPESQQDIIMPFTDDLPQSYRQTYGEDVLRTLPEMFWELPEGAPSLGRYRLHQHICERFASTFCDQIGQWCEKHNIMLTGHMMEEPTLRSQTAAIGDAMRSYEHFQLPGIDMLCAGMELTTAKQAQSAARQYGRPGVLSELYGVTGWDYDFAGHKQHGDWQAALGITVRVHHLSWVSMEGEAKRDYPASIFYQSPWWREYRVVEDHFARVNYAMTRGRPVARIAVVHPVESYWLSYGPESQTATRRQEMEDNFRNVTSWLLHGLLDFDFLSESLLPRQEVCPDKGTLRVGQMAYDVIIVPGLATIRQSTLDILKRFVDAGGRVVFMGEAPEFVGAVRSDAAAELARRASRIPFSRSRLLAALEDVRELGVYSNSGGRLLDGLLCQIRADGDERYVFICNTDAKNAAGEVLVRLRGEWEVSLLDTGGGVEYALAATRGGGLTEFVYDLPAHGHILVRLSGKKAALPQWNSFKAGQELGQLAGGVPVTLSEPNVLVLDQARWRYEGGQWQGCEELLRLENRVRALAGLPERNGNIAQPWAEAMDATPHGEVELAFTLDVRHAVSGAELALENPQNFRIALDGKPLDCADRGWWVDESIRKIALPDLSVGTHELSLRCAVSRVMALEWCYVLGDFGVQMLGRRACITPPVRTLEFGDWRAQGLPFYTGNVTYHCRAKTEQAQQFLRIPHFSGAMVSVDENGKRLGNLAFAPYQLLLEGAGERGLDITLFGTRGNAFGCLHRVSTNAWIGPYAWRSGGDEWAYEYQTIPMGILSAPRLMTAK